MTHDEAFIREIMNAPDEDAPWQAYADWLEKNSDPRGALIRAWFALREASYPFSLAVSVNPGDADFEEFERPLRSYQKSTANAEYWDWLYKLGKQRAWINLHVATQICHWYLWVVGDNGFTIEDTFKMDRYFLFRCISIECVASVGSDIKRSVSQSYLVHQYLGLVECIGTYSPNSILRAMEHRHHAWPPALTNTMASEELSTNL